MAKPIASSDAKRVSQKHGDLLRRITSAVALGGKYKQNVQNAVNELAAKEVINVLKGVPVEELNRDKNGIKTKTLRDSNFCTMADVYNASARSLEAIKGISADAANTIKKTANEFAEAAAKQIKIRLNADDKNAQSSRLVLALSIYKNSIDDIECLNALLSASKSDIETALVNIKPATSGLKWLFTSKEKKEKAVSAYETLNGLLNGEYGTKSTAHLREIEESKLAIANTAWMEFEKDPVSFYTALEGISPERLGSDDTVYGLPEELARAIQEQPIYLDGLNCTLRRYQEWGVKYILHQEKVLLGDEMGLGKTVQAIAAMVSLMNTGATHFVVVCPASVLSNWCREIQKHSVLAVTKVHGDDKAAALESWKQSGGVAVTTFETTGHFKLDDGFKFSMLAVDEAHYIKNPEARRTVNTAALCKHAERILFMTGTALENKVEEMISLIQNLRPEIAEETENIAFMSQAPQFREKVAPVYYRRKRDDVLTELPDLIESKEWCTLSGEEEDIYETAVLEKRYADVRRVSWNVDDLSKSSKAERLKEIVEEAEEEGRKIIVFSFFLDTVEKISKFLGTRCMPIINGSVPPQRRQEIIDEFDKAPAGSVLIAQIQSGGTGLNIQTASVVVICEPQFKPSIENQAISRAYRMGQARSVLVYRLLSDDTADEKITQMLEEKQAIFDAFADKSAVAEESFELDNNTFGTIIEEEIARINAKRGNGTNATNA